MSKTIKISTKVNNSSALASHEVEGVIMDVIEQLCDVGFEQDDIMDGIELAVTYSLRMRNSN